MGKFFELKTKAGGIFRSAFAFGTISILCASPLQAADENGIANSGKSPLVGLKKTSIGPVPSGTNMYIPDTTLRGVLKNQLIVSGTVRFLTIYRNMQKSYDDMLTSDRNISFLDYPLTNVGTSSTGGFPVLELNLTSNLPGNFNFNVGYSFAHGFTGITDNANARNISSRQNLYFTGKLNTDIANLNLSAGSILWTSISRFTMGQYQYRDNYFERLPWDWYRNSFQRFDEYYSLNTNLGGEASGRSPVQGFVGTLDFYKAGLALTSVFGRTNRSVAIANASNQFPSYTYAGRLDKSFFSRYVEGRVGINYYRRSAETDKTKRITDLNDIISVDGKVKWKKVVFGTEIGMGRIQNPANDNTKGMAFTFRTEWDQAVSPIPFALEIYQIHKNVVSIDGGIINSNRTVRDGGFATEFIYDNMLMINVAQEVGQISNNRRGLSLNGDAKIGKLKIQFGMAMSQEIENLYDTITIQHRVNAFSRSRFRPWFQAGGNYGRIKSGWRRTFETLTITDPPTAQDYKKGFNTLELLLKYKLQFLGKDVVIMNMNAFSSIQDKFMPIPQFSTDAFVRTLFSDITVAYRLGKKYALSGYAGFEKVMGGQRIDLADANGQRIDDASGKPTFDPNGKTINQSGFGFGVGIDYDFSSTAGLHLRHTWMSHKDKNFVLDEFKGQETTFELKLFF